MRHYVNDEKLFDVWAAGFLDGEGCFCIGVTKKKNMRSGYYFLPVVSANQTRNRKPIDLLQSNYGGSVRVDKRKINNPNHNDAFVWQLTGVVLLETALERILPHLMCKSRQASLMLEYLSMAKNFNGFITKDQFKKRLEIANQLRLLNGSCLLEFDLTKLKIA